MMRLCAFADEISPDLGEQIEVLQSEGIDAIELRSVWDTNVLALTDAQIDDLQRQITDAGIIVGCIGSPIGKVSIGDAHGEVGRLERAIRIARRFDTHLIRVFSFYPPADTEPYADFEEHVINAMAPLVEMAHTAGITLVHENEKGIYGDTVAHCRALMETFGDQGLASAFDPANFIQCGEKPYPDGFDALQPWTTHVHVKDALPNGNVVAAGEGTTNWPALLERLHQGGYAGLLSLEPHLAQAGLLGGFSGADRFRHASRALQTLLRDVDLP